MESGVHEPSGTNIFKYYIFLIKNLLMSEDYLEAVLGFWEYKNFLFSENQAPGTHERPDLFNFMTIMPIPLKIYESRAK